MNALEFMNAAPPAKSFLILTSILFQVPAPQAGDDGEGAAIVPPPLAQQGSSVSFGCLFPSISILSKMVLRNILHFFLSEQPFSLYSSCSPLILCIRYPLQSPSSSSQMVQTWPMAVWEPLIKRCFRAVVRLGLCATNAQLTSFPASSSSSPPCASLSSLPPSPGKNMP